MNPAITTRARVTHSPLRAVARICFAALLAAVAAQPASAVVIMATNGSSLTRFDSNSPGSTTTFPVTGLQPGETLVGIDFRPASGVLYGVGTTNRLYTLNTATGVATQVGTAGQFTLNGTAFGTDFNPLVDRIRQVSNTEQNLRINPNTAALTATDSALNPAGNIVAVAYSNNNASGSPTTLYAIDSVAGTLVTIGGINSSPSPNLGSINTVGSLGLGTNLNDSIGFDITEGGTAFATITAAGQSRLFSINLTTGAATLVGTIGSGVTSYLGMSGVITPPPGVALVATNGTSLTRFNSAFLSSTATVPITGMQSGETLVGIDYRPATGVLYGLGTTNRVYTLDPTTGAATQVGPAGSFALNGTAFGMDFNPLLNVVREVSNTEQNQRINPNTAVGISDTALNPAGNVVAIAYDRNYARPSDDNSATTLFGIDSASGLLVRIGGLNGFPSPNSGTMTNLGTLGIGAPLNENIGFDVAANGTAFATITVGAQSRLYSIDLTNGTALFRGVIGNGATSFRGLAAVMVPTPAAICYAVDNNNNLLRFSTVNPGAILSSTPIAGLAGGDLINGLDFRAATGELYALGSGNRIYKINPSDAVATQIGADGAFNLSATSFGFDFNNVVDRIRVNDSDEENIRLNPDDGTLAGTDQPLSYAAGDPNSGEDPSLGGAAYTDNFFGAASTTLFGIDTRANALVRQGGVDGGPSPNSGQLFTVGVLGINPIDDSRRVNTAFDIHTAKSGVNTGYAAITTDGLSSQLYHINLTTGAASALGRIGSSTLVRAMAIAPASRFELSAPAYTVGEGGTSATIVINRIGGAESLASVRVTTTDGTATAGDDYTPIDGIFVFDPGQTSKTLNIQIADDSSDEADETVNVTLSSESGESVLGLQASAILTIIDDDKAVPVLSATTSPPTTVGQPLSGTASITSSVNAGGTITFNFFGPDDASCGGAPIFTSVVPVNGDGTYTSGLFNALRTGTYRLTASYSGDAANTARATSCGDSVVEVTPATILANIATRMRVETGDNVLIGGIIVGGTLPKRMLVRAIGPSSGVAGSLGDPYLELYSGPDLVAENDNWRDAANQQEIIDSTIAPADDRESAILITLNPGQYTAVMSGVNGETGVGVVEAYDLDRTVDSNFANIATRGLVQTDDNVMIGGLIILGDATQKVLVRAIGPSLPVDGKLADPTLELVDANGDTFAANDNWRDTQQAEIEATTIQPTEDLESAILATLAPAPYTAIVRGVEGGIGVALVEVYALD